MRTIDDSTGNTEHISRKKLCCCCPIRIQVRLSVALLLVSVVLFVAFLAEVISFQAQRVPSFEYFVDDATIGTEGACHVVSIVACLFWWLTSLNLCPYGFLIGAWALTFFIPTMYFRALFDFASSSEGTWLPEAMTPEEAQKLVGAIRESTLNLLHNRTGHNFGADDLSNCRDSLLALAENITLPQSELEDYIMKAGAVLIMIRYYESTENRESRVKCAQLHRDVFLASLPAHLAPRVSSGYTYAKYFVTHDGKSVPCSSRAHGIISAIFLSAGTFKCHIAVPVWRP